MGVDRNIKIWLLLTKKVVMTALNTYYEPTEFQVIKPQNDLSKVYVSCGLKSDQVIRYFVLVLNTIIFCGYCGKFQAVFSSVFHIGAQWFILEYFIFHGSSVFPSSRGTDPH